MENLCPWKPECLAHIASCWSETQLKMSPLPSHSLARFPAHSPPVHKAPQQLWRSTKSSVSTAGPAPRAVGTLGQGKVGRVGQQSSPKLGLCSHFCPTGRARSPWAQVRCALLPCQASWAHCALSSLRVPWLLPCQHQSTGNVRVELAREGSWGRGPMWLLRSEGGGRGEACSFLFWFLVFLLPVACSSHTHLSGRLFWEDWGVYPGYVCVR